MTRNPSIEVNQETIDPSCSLQFASTTSLPASMLGIMLADLYQSASPKSTHECISQILCRFKPRFRLIANVSLRAKTICQGSQFNFILKILCQ